MKLNDSVSTIILWLRGIEKQLENLEESALWKCVTEAMPDDYVNRPYGEHINSAVAEIFDLANRLEELRVRLETELDHE